MTRLRWLTVATVLFIVVGCASDKMTRQELLARNEQLISQFLQEQKLEPRAAVQSFRYSGWQSIDEQHLILNYSVTRSYLIKLVTTCSELRFAQRIKVNTSGIGLNAKFDTIRVVPDGRYDCRIDKIYPLSREQVNQLKARIEKQKQ